MTFRNLFSLLPLAGILMFVGCGKLPDEKTDKPADSDPHAEHAHPSEGPHHGMLVELGNEEYHAELLFPEHNETSAVTVYILDRSAKKTVPIAAESITLNMTHDGKPEQFKLPAKPQEGDPEGKSSRFSSSDEDVLHHFGEAELQGRLAVKIDGKSYNGQISHDHEHDRDHGEHAD